MAEYCDHGYGPQRSGDGSGTNGACGVCEDIVELKSKLAAAEQELADVQVLLKYAESQDVTLGKSGKSLVVDVGGLDIFYDNNWPEAIGKFADWVREQAKK